MILLAYPRFYLIDVREEPAVRGRNTEGFMGLVTPLRFLCLYLCALCVKWIGYKNYSNMILLARPIPLTNYDLLFTWSPDTRLLVMNHGIILNGDIEKRCHLFQLFN